MKKSNITLIVVIVALAAILGGGCSVYNGLVTLEQEVDAAWAKVEVQYQRRLDLIPNLVETVKGYASHESNTLESVTRARAGLSDAYTPPTACATPPLSRATPPLSRATMQPRARSTAPSVSTSTPCMRLIPTSRPIPIS